MTIFLDQFDKEKKNYTSHSRWTKRLTVYLIIECLLIKRYRGREFVMDLFAVESYSMDYLVLIFSSVLTWIALGILLFIRFRNRRNV